MEGKFTLSRAERERSAEQRRDRIVFVWMSVTDVSSKERTLALQSAREDGGAVISVGITGSTQREKATL